MNLAFIDWVILIIFAALLCIVAYKTKKYTQSTADFLAANRCAGRYLLTFASGIANIGTISLVAIWQQSYKVGFAAGWWGNLATPVVVILTLAGWVIYRYRETRCFTLAQFFEKRYSRNFRVLAGIICWISGIINFGIFPAVTANFFIYYCGLPEHFPFFGLNMPTYHFVVVLLVGAAFYFTFVGGQISVIVTDFIQSFFSNIIFVVLLILLLVKYPLGDVFDGLRIAEPGKSMLNPFDAGRSDFSPWYFIIAIVSLIINQISWQGSQAYNCSAKSPHEAKMAGVLTGFRGWGFFMVIALIPLVAYMFMHNPKYATEAARVNEMLTSIKNEQVRDQMLVPLTMPLYMPIGLMGAFAAVMFAAFIGSSDTYMHSWGSIFVQDIILPLRKKPFTNAQHLLALRLSVLFVGVFITLFSMFFRQTQHILYFFALTGAIWMGGVGAVIIGGLYTRWGNTAGAYIALITGSVIATTGLICEQLWTSWYDSNFFLPTQYVYIGFIALVAVAVIIAGRTISLKWGKWKGFAVFILGLLVIGVCLIIIETKTGRVWRLSNWPWPEHKFIMNGQYTFFFAMMISLEAYTFVGVFSKKRTNYNLDKLLHRGEYRIASDHAGAAADNSPNKTRLFSLKNLFGIDDDFTLGDKLIYGFSITHSSILFLLFIVVTTIALTIGMNEEQWGNYHYYVFFITIITSFGIAVWLAIGGICDLVRLLKDLGTKKRDFEDDGRVEESVRKEKGYEKI